ncbi:MAG: hypothetical protein V4580_19945 [Bacteroidota bacterium]
MKFKLRAFLALITLFSFNQVTNAQSFKGKWLLEGNLGNIHLSKDKTTQSSYPSTYVYITKRFSGSVDQRIGYFVNNAVALGIGVNYGTSYEKSNSDHVAGIGYSNTSLKVGTLGLIPFIRCYLSGKNSNNKLYVQVEGNYNRALFNTQTLAYYKPNGNLDNTQKRTTNSSAYGGAVLIGFNHFFNEYLAFNTNIGYGHQRSKLVQLTEVTFYPGGFTGNSGYSEKTVSNNLLWNFGFTFVLGGKHKEEIK